MAHLLYVLTTHRNSRGEALYRLWNGKLVTRRQLVAAKRKRLKREAKKS